MCASEKGCNNIVRMLLSAGAKVDLQNKVSGDQLRRGGVSISEKWIFPIVHNITDMQYQVMLGFR